MKFDPRTEARDEEENSDLLMTVNNWTLAEFLCLKLYNKYPKFSFSRSNKSFTTNVKIAVVPSPEQYLYNQMQGYAQATWENLILMYPIRKDK